MASLRFGNLVTLFAFYTDRPADPLHFLGHFLIDRSNQQKSDQQESTSTSNASVPQNQDEKMY
jgi:hypothetical protein